MKINIYNHQTKLRLSKCLLQKLIREMLNHERVNCNEVSLYLVDEKAISLLHKKYFDDSSATDCISFPIDSPTKENKNCFLGEVFVCIDTAIKYAKQHDLDPLDETALYIIHGLLHLIGFDDISQKDKTSMHKKEKSCMNLIKAKKLGVNTKHTQKLMEAY